MADPIPATQVPPATGETVSDPPATGDQSPPVPPATGAPPADTDPPANDLTAMQAALAKANDEAKRSRLELAELRPLAAQARKLEEDQKTEQQKLTEQLEAATANSTKAASDLERLDVALAKAPAGLPPERIRALAGRLQGTTREELEADADVLFAEIGIATTNQAPPATGGTPVENLRPGALPTTPTAPLPEQIAAAETAGNTELAMQLKTRQLMELQNKT